MARLTGARFAIAFVLMSWGLCGEVRAEEHEEHREHEEHGEHEDHESPPLALGIDFVVGFGAYPLALPTRAGAAATENEGELPAGWASVGNIRVNSESLIIAGSYEVAEHVGVGLRIPITFGSVPAPDSSSNGTFAFGNVELEGETEIELSETAALVLSLGVALPTAQGSEEPELEDGAFSHAYDRFVLNQIAASSRGFEDNALFEVDRLGIIPKLGLNAREGRMLFEPFVKLENLIGTNSDLERKYIGELVFGMFFGAEASEHFDVGARVWASAAFLDEVEEVGIVEPQVRAHFAPLDVVLGGIIPFAGKLTEPQFGGVRLSAVARL